MSLGLGNTELVYSLGMGLAEKGGPSWAVAAKLDDGLSPFLPAHCTQHESVPICFSSGREGLGPGDGNVLAFPGKCVFPFPGPPGGSDHPNWICGWGWDFPGVLGHSMACFSLIFPSSILSCYLGESLALLLGGQDPQSQETLNFRGSKKQSFQ